jgi:hypothetical protein
MEKISPSTSTISHGALEQSAGPEKGIVMSGVPGTFRKYPHSSKVQLFVELWLER